MPTDATSPAAELTANAVAPARTRYPEIDWLKGCAILCVLLIHANIMVRGVLGVYVINRAVPIFLILFGVTSELWYRREGEKRERVALLWYESRFRRLMPPVWGMVTVWVGLVVLLGGPVVLTPRVVAALAIGYLPWIGTGWFVTLILQIVAIYPIFRFATSRIGPVITILLTVSLVIAGRLYPVDIIVLMQWLFRQSGRGVGLWYLEIFVPTKLLGVFAGMLLAPRIAGMRGRWVALCAALVVLGDGVHATTNSADVKEVILTITDIPLVIALLGCVKIVRVWPAAAALLAWCGVTSWGIYLGQTLVHDWVHLLGMEPEQMALPYRVTYLACLFVGAVGLVAIGEAVRKISSRQPAFVARA